MTINSRKISPEAEELLNFLDSPSFNENKMKSDSSRKRTQSTLDGKVDSFINQEKLHEKDIVYLVNSIENYIQNNPNDHKGNLLIYALERLKSAGENIRESNISNRLNSNDVEQKVASIRTSVKDIEDSISRLTKKASDYEGQLLAFQERIENEIRLSKAVEHWGNQIDLYEKYYKSNRFYAVLAAAAIIIIGILSIFLIAKTKIFTEQISLSSVFIIIIFGVIITIPLVLFRVQVKIALSNLHLKSEAENKNILTKVYLSLLEESKEKGIEVKDEQRAIILASLFHPSNVGLIKDEGYAPDPSIVAALSKAFSK